MAKTKTKGSSLGKPDFATFGGLALALFGILGGLLLEGGKIQDVAQITAALIVLGGTLGAVMVSTPGSVLKGAARRFQQIWFHRDSDATPIVEELIDYATKARKSGLVSLEAEAQKVNDPFLRKALNLAVDGADSNDLRSTMEVEIQIEESRALAEAKVFESAGGYSPTIGIIGAVMGLIQVMKNLANIEEVGHGIAVAFVATVYGVGLANLVLLPAATKIKTRVQQQMHIREMMLTGVLGIIEGLNPKLIRVRLEGYLEPKRAVPVKAARRKPKEVADPATAVS